MAEPPLALFGFLAPLFLRRSPARMLFAALLSVAILTKPSAWGLALATPVALWFTGNARRLSGSRLRGPPQSPPCSIPFFALTFLMARAGMEQGRMRRR